MNNVDATVLNVIHSYLGMPVLPTATLEEADIDSLDRVELAMTLEDEFNIEIPDEEVEKFVTIQSIIDCVHRMKELQGK